MNRIENNDMNEKKKRKKGLIILACLLIFIMLMGVLAAFFSDYIFRRSDIGSGTLKINGTYTFLLNGEETGSAITDLKPGDIIVVRADIASEGSLAAWVRETITFTPSDSAILPYINVFDGEVTSTQIAGGGLTALSLNGGIFKSTARVLDASGATEQTGGEDGFIYIGADNYTAAYTIYFLPSAGNDAQGINAELTVATEALQFENNNSELPNESAWTEVTAA